MHCSTQITLQQLGAGKASGLVMICCFSALTHKVSLCLSPLICKVRVGGKAVQTGCSQFLVCHPKVTGVFWSSCVRVYTGIKYHFPYCAWNQKNYIWVSKSYQVLVSWYTKWEQWQFSPTELLWDLKEVTVGEPLLESLVQMSYH